MYRDLDFIIALNTNTEKEFQYTKARLRNYISDPKLKLNPKEKRVFYKFESYMERRKNV
jgi:succinylglutamate desuccinylase